MKPLRTLVVGLGHMGVSHALSYHSNPGFDIVAICNRSPPQLPDVLSSYPVVHDFTAGMTYKPDVVSINTYTDSHAPLAIAALEAGCHVFLEKPIAGDLPSAQAIVRAAHKHGRKLLIGHVLRHQPTWVRFILEARRLGPPYVMRMTLNQQSSGARWRLHQRLMEATSPLVDSGIHYLDAMLQITGCRPVQVHSMGVRLTDEIAPDQVNFSHLQVSFEDGSVGWFEAGWGPMISATAFFVKDVFGPRGSVSIIDEPGSAGAGTSRPRLRVHSGALRPDGGGVGLSCVQGADHAGARTIIAVDVNPQRLALATQLGATQTILASREDAGLAAVAAEVRALLGRGADYAFECTAVPALAAAPLAMIENGGVAVAVSGVEEVVQIDMQLFEFDKIYVNPLYGQCRPSIDFPRLLGLYAQRRLLLDELVTNVYPLTRDGLAQAFDNMKLGVGAKSVLLPDCESGTAAPSSATG